jgi:hypothetical protein
MRSPLSKAWEGMAAARFSLWEVMVLLFLVAAGLEPGGA